MKTIFLFMSLSLSVCTTFGATNIGTKIGTCHAPDEAGTLEIFKLQKPPAQPQYFAVRLDAQNVASRPVGPADDVVIQNNGNTLLMGFNTAQIGVLITKGTNTKGVLTGEVGGSDLICNATW